MKRLGVGVIGLGVGAQHLEAYSRRDDCDVRAICDLSPETLAQYAALYPQARAVADASGVLRDPSIDVVSIASYDNHHASQVIEAFEQGKHVFVEKPLCLSRREFDGIADALRRHPGLQLSSNLILRKSPRFVELRRMIRAGELGEIFHMEGDYLYGRLHKIVQGWRGEIDGYSVVHGGAIHLIDLLMWLLDDRVIEVMGYGNAIASRGSAFRYNDMVVSVLRFANGALGKISANFGCVHPHFHGLAVYGTKATYRNGPDAAWLYTSRDPHDEPRRIATPYPGTHKGDLIGSFLDSIQQGSEPDVTAADVLNAMSVSLAIEEAVQSGGPVCVVAEVFNA